MSARNKQSMALLSLCVCGHLIKLRYLLACPAFLQTRNIGMTEPATGRHVSFLFISNIQKKDTKSFSCSSVFSTRRVHRIMDMDWGLQRTQFEIKFGISTKAVIFYSIRRRAGTTQRIWAGRFHLYKTDTLIIPLNHLTTTYNTGKIIHFI